MKFVTCEIELKDGRLISMLVRDSMEAAHMRLLCQKLGHEVISWRMKE